MRQKDRAEEKQLETKDRGGEQLENESWKLYRVMLAIRPFRPPRSKEKLVEEQN
jgi:hypothetical protein